MLLTIGNKVIHSKGRFLSIERNKDIVLKFDVTGSFFPSRRLVTSTAYMRIVGQSSVSNKMYIDFNDGTGEHEYIFKASGTNRAVYFSANATATTPATISGTSVYDYPVYFYQDLPEGIKNTVNDFYDYRRTISIRFEKPQSVAQFSVFGTYMYGSLPSAISKLYNLATLYLYALDYITSFPQDFLDSRIKNLQLYSIGNVMGNGIPVWVLNSSYLETLNLGDSVDLSGDPEVKRFTQINKLKNSLANLVLSTAGINYRIPQEFSELLKLQVCNFGSNTSNLMRFPLDLSGLTALKEYNLYNTRMPFSEIERIMVEAPTNDLILRFGGCNYTANYDITAVNTKVKRVEIGRQTWGTGATPSFVSKLTNLRELSLSTVQSSSLYANLNAYGNFSACVNLELLDICRMTNISTVVPAWFNTLTKLKTVICYASFQSSGGIDAFVNSWYTFTVANAAMTGAGTLAFRGMAFSAYGSSSIVADQTNSTRPSGTYQQPAGYVQGTNNGTPATPMEKIWVLTKQYNHVWTVKP